MSISPELPRCLKRIFVGCGLAWFSLTLTLFFLRGCEHLLGADIEGRGCCEPRPAYWVKDPLLGYRNKPDFSNREFGRLICRTNSQGLRSYREFLPQKPAGTYRIMGIGDSIMEGGLLNAQDSFLGVLDKLLRQRVPGVEVINAGVVGYGAYQTRVYFEQYAVRYSPDVVLVSYCSNDFLPTEDPFTNLRQIYIGYLNGLLSGKEHALSAEEARSARQLISILRSACRVWEIYEALEGREKFRRVLLEIPILEMNKLARERRIRLVFMLFDEDPRLEEFLKEQGIDYLAFHEELYAQKYENIYNKAIKSRFWLKSRPFLGRGWFKAIFCFNLFDPVETLSNIAQYVVLEIRNLNDYSLDGLHPSRKASRMIAARMYKYLIRDAGPAISAR